MTLELTLTPELAEFLQSEDNVLQAELESERHQREISMHQQEQLLGVAVDQHVQLEHHFKAFNTTAEDQHLKIDEAVQNMGKFADDWKAQLAQGAIKKMNIESGKSTEMAEFLNPFKSTEVKCTGSFWQRITGFVRSQVFDAMVAAVICANAICVGATADREIRNYDNYDDSGGVYTLLKFVFPPFYIVELIIKLIVYRLEFFTNDDKYWNMFDLLLVITGCYDLIDEAVSDDASGSNMSWMRMLRLAKMMRMLRMVRVMRFFRELRIMLYAIVGSLRSFFWTVMMLSLIMYIFGLAFLQAITTYLTEATPEELDNDGYKDDALKYYGGVAVSMTTLFQAITGGNDWENLARPLQAAGGFYYGLFLFYIAFLTFAVLNVFTGIFVDNAMQVAKSDRDNVIHEEMDRERSYANALRGLFAEIDADKSGSLSWEEFKSSLKREEVDQYFKAMELDATEARELFLLLDTGGSGSVEIDEFMKGCAKLRGNAKSIDLVHLMSDQRALSHRLAEFMRFVEDAFDDIFRFFERSGGKPSQVETLQTRLHQRRLNIPGLFDKVSKRPSEKPARSTALPSQSPPPEIERESSNGKSLQPPEVAHESSDVSGRANAFPNVKPEVVVAW